MVAALFRAGIKNPDGHHEHATHDRRRVLAQSALGHRLRPRLAKIYHLVPETVTESFMRLSNPFLRRLGVEHPIIAAAVSNASGVGSLGLSASTVDQARAMLDEVSSLTRGAINVNVF
jgi:hypothetical protein